MNDDRKLDFGALDPMRDPVRWHRVVEATLNRLDPTLSSRRRQDPLTLIAEWSRPVIITSVATLAVVLSVEVALEFREEQLEQVRRLVELSGGLALPGEAPSGAEFLRALTTGGATQ